MMSACVPTVAEGGVQALDRPEVFSPDIVPLKEGSPSPDAPLGVVPGVGFRDAVDESLASWELEGMDEMDDMDPMDGTPMERHRSNPTGSKPTGADPQLVDATVEVDGPPPARGHGQTVVYSDEGRVATVELGTFDVSGSGPLGSPPMPVETKTLVGATAVRGPRPGPGDHLQYFGDYQLISELARGGMGVVYRARQLTLGRMVALKMILAGALATDYAIKRFLIEAEAAARLDHPNIVPIYEIGEHEGLHYFSMKFVEGRSLAAMTRGLIRDPKRVARIMARVARAVAHAHQRGILHRDLKPSNILIDEDGEPHVTDFGLAKILAEGREGEALTMEGSVMGTPSYMAPEQAEGKSATLTTAADIWGLGAILYDCLTGVPPFKGDTALATVAMVRTLEPRPPEAINPDLPRDLATICLKCLQKEPGKRYASADDLAQDLENWLSGKPITARPIGRIERLRMWTFRHPALAGLAAMVVLSVTLGLAGVLWQWTEAVQARKAETAARRVAEARALQLQEQALRIRLQLNRAELQRGRMLMQAGDPDRAEAVLWSAALGSPWATERYQSTTMPLTAGPFTPAEWALWDLYRQQPREGTLPDIQATSLAVSHDGRLVAGASAGQLTVQDWVTGRMLLAGQTTSTLLAYPDIAPDGSAVAVADFISGRVMLWDLPKAGPPSETVTTMRGQDGRTTRQGFVMGGTSHGQPRLVFDAPGAGKSGESASLLRSNPRVLFVDPQRILIWNPLAMELRAVGSGELLAYGPGTPDATVPADEVEVELVPPPRGAPESLVALVALGQELRPIKLLNGASRGLIEWDLALPMGDDRRKDNAGKMPAPRIRGRWPVRMSQAGRLGSFVYQTPAGALVAATSDGTSITEVQRLGRDEVPRLESLSLAADKLNVVGLSGRSLYVWSYPELQLQKVAPVLGGGQPTTVRALPGGRWCLVAEFDQSVARYSIEAQTMEPIREATTVMGGLIFDVGTTGPGALVPMSEGRASIQLWNQGQAREVDRANPQEPGFDMALRIREDGTSLALLTALGLGPAVEMVSLAAGTSSSLIRLNTPPGAVAMNLGVAGDGSVVAALTSQDLVILRAGEGEGGVDQRLVPLQGIATDVSVTDCGSTVAVAMKGRIFLVDSTSGTSRPVELKPGQTVSNSVFSDNGRLLLAPTGEDVALIQVPEGRVSGSLVSATGGRIVAAALSPGGGLAASVSREGRLSLWDVTTRDELASINLESGALMQVRFMPGGKRVRWWGEKQSGIFDLEQGFGRLAKNLPDRLPVVLPSIVGQAGALSTLELVRALRPYGGQSAVDAEQTLTNLVRGRKAAGGQ
jgi:hypothetical protein